MITTSEEKVETQTTDPANVAQEPAKPTSALILTHYDEIRVKERDVRKWEDKYLHAKEVAAQRKKAFERADTALRALIARGPDSQQSLPFAESTEPVERVPLTVCLTVDVDSIDFPSLEFSKGQVCNVVLIDGEVCIDAGEGRYIEITPDEYNVVTWSEPEPDLSADETDKRSLTSVEDVFDAPLAKRLIKAGFMTIGDIGAHTASGKRLDEIAGIGPGYAEQMDNSLSEFWSVDSRSVPVEPIIEEPEPALAE